MSTRLHWFSRFMFVSALLVMLIGGLAPVVAQDEACAHKRLAFRPEDAPPFASGGKYWVGVREAIVEAPEGDVRAGRFGGIPVTIWYPALNSDCVEEHTTYEEYELLTPHWASLFPREGRAIRDAAPDTEAAPYPLVIYSHGAWNHPWTAHYLTEHLASRGFVVIAPVHEDNVIFSEVYRGLVSRPKDITRMIDYAETITAPGESFAGMIDTEKVAVIGHSYGGMTAMLAAGAQLNLGLWKQACPTAQNWVARAFCSDVVSHEQELAQLAGSELPLDVVPSFADRRVDVAVALAPGSLVSGQNYESESLQRVTASTMLLAGSADPQAPPEEARSIFETIASTDKALIVFENAGHGLFMVSCENPPFTKSTDCNYDPVWDMDHAHDLINHYVAAFLDLHLGGSVTARNALQLGRFDFLGITYETTLQ